MGLRIIQSVQSAGSRFIMKCWFSFRNYLKYYNKFQFKFGVIYRLFASLCVKSGHRRKKRFVQQEEARVNHIEIVFHQSNNKRK